MGQSFASVVCMCTLPVCVWLGGCGDPPLDAGLVADATSAASDADDALFGGTTDGTNSVDAGAGSDVLNDGGTADSTATDTTTADGAANQDAADTNAPDSGWTQPDIDLSELTVLATDPKNGALGAPTQVTFTITFSAAVFDAAIAAYTVLVTDAAGQEIAGDFTVKGAVVTFKAKQPTMHASVVNVQVTNYVRGTSGQTLAAPYAFHFYTDGYKDTEAWAKLASRYAPTIRQAVQGTWPKNDALGAWASAASTPEAQVAWAIAATRSHYFVHYQFYWPHHAADPSFDDDTAGATVIVARYPKERPVGLVTWFKHLADEQRWLWLTNEGALMPGTSTQKANVRKLLSEDALFGATEADGARRYEALLTAGSHQSCLWSDQGEFQNKQCLNIKQTQVDAKWVRYLPAKSGSTATDPTTITPADFDKAMPEATYALVSLHDTAWPRRADATLFKSPLTFVYAAPSGRPGLAGSLGSQLAGATQDFGRPAWAWRWKPGTNATYYDLPRGTVFFDPAWALWQRLGGKTNGVKAWDQAGKTGLSLDYCFAPFLGIDARETTECKAMTPPL